MKPFDDKFSDNVREVFDAWQEPVDEQAWQQMKGRLQPASRSVIPLWPWWLKASAAAVLLGFLSLGTWLGVQQWGGQHQAILATAEQNATSVIVTQEEMPVVEAEKDKDSENAHLIQETVGTSPARLQSRPTQSEHAKHASVAPIAATFPDTHQPESAMVQDAPVPMPVAETIQPSAQLPLAGADPASIAELPESGAEPMVSLPETPDAKHIISDEERIRENLALLAYEPAAGKSPAALEFSAGTLKTWSKQEMAGGMGVAAGVTGHWALGPRWSISSGGGMMYNQFQINEAGTIYSRLESDAYSAIPNIHAAQNVRLLEEQVHTDYEFMAVDIPLNFRYQILNMRNAHIYLSAGISSLVYLHQQYETTREILAELSGTGSEGVSFVNTNFVSVSQEGGFSAMQRIDFARFLNLSAGYVVKGRRQSVIIEPYLKYPLGDITSLNFQIGMAGISLKYRPFLP